MLTSKNTVAKTAIQALLNGAQVALSQAEIQLAINNMCDRVTTYRVLDRLVTEGVLHKIINTDGVIKYAVCHTCTAKHVHNHIHFSCNSCKAVTCLVGVIPSYNIPKKYLVTDVNFTVSGICPNCK